MEKELEKIYNAIRKDKDFADLTDAEILTMAEMELKAKGVKNYVQGVAPSEKAKKPRTVKISDAKKELFTDLVDFLTETYADVTVVKDNKLIEITFDNKVFKLDLIETRPKKA